MDGNYYHIVTKQIDFSGPSLQASVAVFDESGVEKGIEGVDLIGKDQIRSTHS